PLPTEPALGGRRLNRFCAEGAGLHGPRNVSQPAARHRRERSRLVNSKAPHAAAPGRIRAGAVSVGGATCSPAHAKRRFSPSRRLPCGGFRVCGRLRAMGWTSALLLCVACSAVACQKDASIGGRGTETDTGAVETDSESESETETETETETGANF